MDNKTIIFGKPPSISELPSEHYAWFDIKPLRGFQGKAPQLDEFNARRQIGST
jgi:hypothetical protein